MYIGKGQGIILAFLLAPLLIYGYLFQTRGNAEFLLYIGVIVLFLLLILFTNKKVQYPHAVLWGLAIWSFLHMSGGGILISDGRLYEVILIPLTEAYPIFRYDQLVHIIGFGVATVLMHHLLRPYLKSKKMGFGLGLVVVMAGLGVGALNEMVEFLATVLVPSTGVGGYVNTSLDLVADFIGALIAVFYIRNNHS